MPLTKCSHCRKVQIIRRDMLGQELGCLGSRCERSFIAREYYRHSGRLSRFVFYGVIGFAIYLAATWWGGQYVTQLKQVIGLFV